MQDWVDRVAAHLTSNKKNMCGVLTSLSPGHADLAEMLVDKGTKRNLRSIKVGSGPVNAIGKIPHISQHSILHRRVPPLSNLLERDRCQTETNVTSVPEERYA